MSSLFVTLFEESRKEIKISVVAFISEDRELRIEGIDYGELVKKLKGDIDYEYFLTVKEAEKESLIKHLQNKNIKVHNDRDLLNWLKQNYSDNSAFSSFQKFLTEENIKFETFFWE